MAFYLRCYVVGSKLRGHQVSLIDFGKAKVAQLHWSILWKRWANLVTISDTVDVEVLGYMGFGSSLITSRYDVLNAQAVNEGIADVLQIIRADNSASVAPRYRPESYP